MKCSPIIVYFLFGLLFTGCSSEAVTEADLEGHTFACVLAPLSKEDGEKPLDPDAQSILDVLDNALEAKAITYRFDQAGRGVLDGGLTDRKPDRITWSVQGDSLYINDIRGNPFRTYQIARDGDRFIIHWVEDGKEIEAHLKPL